MGVRRERQGGAHCADEERFAKLYARCYQPVRDFCARRVPLEAVDDAVADTFLIVWRRLDEVPAGEAALVWTYGVAYRVIGHQRRSATRRSRLHNRLRAVAFRPVAATDEHTVDDEEQRIVLAALARLGDTDVEVLRMVAWEQLSVVDVAAVLRIEADTARQRLHRARRNLAREYERIRSHPTSVRTAPTGGAE